MRSSLAVTTPAGDLSLLTQSERREAAGLAAGDASQDAKLAALDLRLAAAIMAECKIAIGAGGEPTLLQETLTETFRGVHLAEIILSRRHKIEITSLTEDDTAITFDTDFVVDPESGLAARLCSDQHVRWCASKIVVVYKAGFTFATIPGDLKQAAMDFMRLAWAEKDRDPSLKSEVVDIPDVRRVERGFWVGSVPGQSTEGAVPDIVAGQLARYRNWWIS
ncbi:hypothetical protein [Mesorhizobium sp. B2-6-1]|uniref:hypothetical protein n=1 Tax=Mesorhizobium sp. B2-6-1 TaxID=2589916 RepID=UPI00112A33D0|nr:hypothetical protein [Mesorhizobium sp. B2-6-1]TPJ60828.1 hypothetical protein FJ443_20010 [Mesorhizobium sp. B2-6-1]